MQKKLIIVTLMLTLLAGGLALSQEHVVEEKGASGDSGGTTAAADDSGIKFTGLLKQGGPLMWPLGLLSVATVALAVMGFLTVQDKKMLTPELVPTLEEALDRMDIDGARTICGGTPSLLTNILNAGLARITDGYFNIEHMDQAMDEAAVEESAAGLKLINYLSIIAQIAPMVGLLGTVSGMIKAFAKIGKGAMGKPEVLAADIGEAMVTTASGLIIGIPAMFLYFYLKGRYTANLSRVGRLLGNLSHRLVASTRRGGPPPADADASGAEAETE